MEMFVDDSLLEIFSFLDLTTEYNISLVCKNWKLLSEHEIFWKKRLQKILLPNSKLVLNWKKEYFQKNYLLNDDIVKLNSKYHSKLSSQVVIFGEEFENISDYEQRRFFNFSKFSEFLYSSIVIFGEGGFNILYIIEHFGEIYALDENFEGIELKDGNCEKFSEEYKKIIKMVVSENYLFSDKQIKSLITNERVFNFHSTIHSILYELFSKEFTNTDSLIQILDFLGFLAHVPSKPNIIFEDQSLRQLKEELKENHSFGYEAEQKFDPNKVIKKENDVYTMKFFSRSASLNFGNFNCYNVLFVEYLFDLDSKNFTLERNVLIKDEIDLSL
eukprot:gene6611-10774_t